MIPDYWLSRPAFQLSEEDKGRLEHLWHSLNFEDIPWIENLPVPKWVFLCWLAEEKDVLLHGSGHSNIQRFEPRAPDAKDDNDFSQQMAVFAASEGIWAMFYAILDRENFRPRFLNGAVQFELPNGSGSTQLSDMRYFFSVNDTVFREGPWREGVVYVLPKEGFVIEPPDQLEGLTIHVPHWANFRVIKPLVKLKVRPEDFPFLPQVRSHNHEQTQAKAKANPKGFPWL
jgi:hypothetical protein